MVFYSNFVLQSYWYHAILLVIIFFIVIFLNTKHFPCRHCSLNRCLYMQYSSIVSLYNMRLATFHWNQVLACIVQVHQSSKYFLRWNKSLHLFETYCHFLSLFNPNLDFLEAVKVTKSGHHLFHDRASKGHGSILGLMSQTSLHAYLQRNNIMQNSLWHQIRNRPMPLTCSVVEQMVARFCNFYSLKIRVKKWQKGTIRFKQVQRFI